MRSTSDVRLMGTDPVVFEAFYREHLDAVRRFVARRVQDPYLAADLTADVFVAAVESAHTYQPGRGSPLGWLYGVARNVVNAERRRAARALTASRRIEGWRLLDSGEIGRLEDRIAAASRARHVYEAMESLSDAERAVLELAALDGLALSDVAHALGITSVTARVRLHRARRRLREVLGTPDPAAAPACVLTPEGQA